MPNLILTTCGTSLFTNERSKEERDLINKYTNEQSSDNIEKGDYKKLLEIINSVKSEVQNANFQRITKLSAELNALVRFYEFKGFPPQDYHILICTDTWLGKEAAEIVKWYLNNHGAKVLDLPELKDLRTDDIESFHVALSDLAKWVHENILGYKKTNYHIVFNLTGGFKSVHGFLQTLALFYADEVIYIFESENKLLRIPRLPVTLSFDNLKDHFQTLRRLSLHLSVEEKHIKKIPDTLLMKINNEVCLSPYGTMIWEQIKEDWYKEKLHPSPHESIRFSPKFEKNVQDLKREPDRLKIINERIDDLVGYIERKHNPSSLDFRQLRGNPRPPSTHECNAWGDRDARRIFMHFEGDILVLDALDKGLH